MAKVLRVHPVNPQQRLLAQAVDVLQSGGVIVYPTDSSYALGCRLGDKPALERIRRVRGVERDHDFTLVCHDLSEIATYARVDNWAYRLLRARTPGPYTFILRSAHGVPKRLQDPKRRSIGIRVPDHLIVQELLELLGEPIMSSTLLLPGDDLPMADPDDIATKVGGQVDLIIDAGVCGIESTTVLDLTEDTVVVIRAGKGDVSALAG